MNRPIPIIGLLAAVLAVTLGLVALTGAHPAHHNFHHLRHSKPPRSFYGIDSQKPLQASDLASMRASGVGVLRAPLYWQVVQPNEDSELQLSGIDERHFTGFDNLVRQAAEQGITVLPYIYGTPNWVARDLDHRDCSYCSIYPPQSPAALSALQNLTHQAALRYGPGGTFWQQNPGVPKRPIRDWQIWNEQNSKTSFKPKPSPRKYLKLLTAAVKGIRSADHSREATIVLGGMFGLPKTNLKPGKAMPASTFVRVLLRHKGAKRHFDGVALHPYSGLFNLVKKQATLMRHTLRKSHDSGTSMWITETGAASGGPNNMLNLGSKKAQAKRVTDTYKLFTKHRKDWNVKLVAWFSWQDVPPSEVGCFFCERMGLVDANGKAKPSLHAYKRAAK